MGRRLPGAGVQSSRADCFLHPDSKHGPVLLSHPLSSSPQCLLRTGRAGQAEQINREDVFLTKQPRSSGLIFGDHEYFNLK